MSDLLKAFMKKHKIEDVRVCPHGCETNHKAYRYRISEEGWGTVYYDCPKVDGLSTRALEAMFPLDPKERQEMRDMHTSLIGVLP